MGKSNATSSQLTYGSGASQQPQTSIAKAQGPAYEPVQFPAPYSIGVITSHDVDLRRDSSVDLGNNQSLTAISLNEGLGSKHATPSMQPSQVMRAAKRKQTPVRTVERKTQSIAQAQAQSLALTSSAQMLTLVSADTSQIPTPETAPTLPQPANASPYAALDQASPKSDQKTTESGPKPSALYVEVGSFKDETWANNAVEKLTQLGFHAVSIHKTLLWAQSFRVQVGPYTDSKDIDAARHSLSSHGFKSHLVN
jgi:cell division protein FtsN